MRSIFWGTQRRTTFKWQSIIIIKFFFYTILVFKKFLKETLPSKGFSQRHGKTNFCTVRMCRSRGFRLTEGGFWQSCFVWRGRGGCFCALLSQWLCLRGRCRRGEPASRGGNCWAHRRGFRLGRRKPSRNCCAVTAEPLTWPFTASTTSGCETAGRNLPLTDTLVSFYLLFQDPVDAKLSTFVPLLAVRPSADRQERLRYRWRRPRWPSTSFPSCVVSQYWKRGNQTGAMRREKDHFHGSSSPGRPNDPLDQRHHWFLERSSWVQVAVCWRSPISLGFQLVKQPCIPEGIRSVWALNSLSHTCSNSVHTLKNDTDFFLHTLLLVKRNVGSTLAKKKKNAKFATACSQLKSMSPILVITISYQQQLKSTSKNLSFKEA